MSRARLLIIGIPLLGLSIAAHADTITYQTPAAATDTDGDAVSAQVVISTGADTLTLTLYDLLVNPTDVGQLLSAFGFNLTLTTGLGPASSSGQEITVNSDGTSTLGGAVAAGWVLTSPFSGSYLLNVLGAGGAGPSHLIIGAPGADGYTNANGSIAGSGSNNPFLDQSVTFTLNLPGVTSDTQVSFARFLFGTSGDEVVGYPLPEPASLSLVGGGLLALGSLRKRLPRQQ